LDKIAATNARSRTADGNSAALKLTKHVEGNGGAWIASVSADTKAFSASIKYGVLTRREQTFLLNYYANYLDASAGEFNALARDNVLPLDIVPEKNQKGVTLQVLFNGNPAVGSEVVIFDPTAQEIEAKTDEAGKVELETAKPGLYSIRAKWVVMQAGKEADQEYPQVNHYSTLALRVSGGEAAAKTTATAKQLTAAQLLHAAREGRAVWDDFPGFEADLKIFAEGREQTGRITITADGGVSLSGIELKDEKTVLAMLRSLIGHRMPGGESDDNVSFADEQDDHPLGRLIKLDYDSAMASAYRIKDGVIREVNRQMDGGRFTISVFEVQRNPEGKYLPGYYTVSFWNKDGALRNTTVTHETWTRVGRFDLPATHASVATGKDDHRNTSLIFSNHKLLERQN
ncbi:MAG TPA: DUF3386 family protein, partial [Pirellulaceae bacterium]|nr:DUF3386 family protein [Pirellulaceae bacterium]